mgnify:CR=1 FL=1
MFSFLFFARLTFITGLSFGASWILLLVKHNLPHDLVSTILTIGFGIAAIQLPVFALTCLYFLAKGGLKATNTPRWLIAANLLFLTLFITFIFYLNGPYYHQP